MIKIMGIRKKIIVALILSVAGIGIGYLFNNLFDIGNCYVNGVYKSGLLCEDVFPDIGNVLIPSMTALSVSLLALTLVPKAVVAWGRFALVAIPLTLFIFLMTPQSNSGGLSGNVGFGPTAAETYFWVSAAFAVLSLIIIAWVAVKSKITS